MKNAPPQLAEIGLDPSAFHYSDSRSWRGPCPACMGHRRFVMFTDHEYPLWHGFCDVCGYKIKVWEKTRRPIDPEFLARAKAGAEREENARAERLAVKLAEFTSADLWSELCRRMGAEQIAWWENRGVPEDIQKYLKLGWMPDKMFYSDDIEYHSPAYSIPWFSENFNFRTMQYRLLNPPDPSDKYRFEKDLPGGGSLYYMTDPGESIKDHVIVCEGAIKGIVTWYWLSEWNKYTTISTASSRTIGACLPALKDADVIYYIPDPDAFRRPPNAKNSTYESAIQKFREAGLSNRVHTVRLPCKIDDCVTEYGLTRERFGAILNQARREI